MKILPLLLAAALLATAASAASFGERPVASIPARVPVNGDTVTPGTGRALVAARLGHPNAVLADGSWLYANYVAHLRPDDAGEPATLVVRFHQDRVTRLSLADGPTTVALRTSPLRPAGQALAVASRR